MATFKVSVVNETFSSSNEHESQSADDARVEAMKALQIGADEVIGGKPFFAAKVKIETGDQTVGRFLISIGASPLVILD